MPGMLNRPHKKCRRSLHGLHGGKCRTVSNKLTLRFSKKEVTSFMSVPTVSCGCISDMPLHHVAHVLLRYCVSSCGLGLAPVGFLGI